MSFLRHVFAAMDEGHGTSGPKSFKGPLGQAVAGDIHRQPLVDFQPIPTNSLPEIPDQVADDLSTDQRLLLRYSRAVAAGAVSPELARAKPGPLNHSRWLTLAIRVLVLYTRTAEPTRALVNLVIFIQQVYAPMWFRIKSRPAFVYGAVHQFRAMQLLKTLPEDVQNVAKGAVQRNAYFAHPENLIAAMLSDPDSAVRDQGVSLILGTRRQAECQRRQFRVPPLNWEANSYTEMIQWDKVHITEPPVTVTLPDSVIESARDQPLELPAFPSHAQSVERCVRLVTEASRAVFGEDRRHGLIVSRQASRAARPRFKTKRDFVA